MLDREPRRYGRRLMVMTRRALAAAAVLMAAACGNSGAAALVRPTPTGSSSAHTVAVAVVPKAPCRPSDEPPEDASRAGTGSRLTDRFVPELAFICYSEQRAIHGDGVWQVLVGQRLTGDLAPLADALRQPDQLSTPPPKDGAVFACAGSLTIYPTLILIDGDGHAIRPRVPLDYCQDQLESVQKAIDALPRSTVQVQKLRQLESPAQIAAAAAATAVGCSPTWKDGFSHGMVPAKLSRGGPLRAAPTKVSLCRYKAVTQEPLLVTYVAGRRLTSAQTAQLFAALTGPGKPGGCTKPHDGILLAFHGPDPAAEIELGGCSRVIRQEGDHSGIGQTDAAIIAELTPS